MPGDLVCELQVNSEMILNNTFTEERDVDQVQENCLFGKGLVWGQVLEVMPGGYRLKGRNGDIILLLAGVHTVTNGSVQVGDQVFSSVRENGVAANITRFFRVPFSKRAA